MKKKLSVYKSARIRMFSCIPVQMEVRDEGDFSLSIFLYDRKKNFT